VELRRRFKAYDQDGSGDIGKKELVLLIEESFPTMAHDAAMRPMLLQMMSEVDANGNGNLDFREFVQLMERFRELDQQDHHDKERHATEETGFSSREIEDFREIFLASSDPQTQQITEQGVMQLMRAVCPLGHSNAAELRQHMKAVVDKAQHTGFTGSSAQRKRRSIQGAFQQERELEQEVDRNLDFPEFLLLMHRLLDTNFADIKTRTG